MQLAQKNDVSKGNEFADKTAKAAAGPFESIATIQKVPQPIDHTILKDMHQSEKHFWKNKVNENSQGILCLHVVLRTAKGFCTACPICAQHNPQGDVRAKRGPFPKSTIFLPHLANGQRRSIQVFSTGGRIL